MAGKAPNDEPVPIGDAQVAADIARAAKRGRGVDRSPTLEQLLAAFGETEPTEQARRRARSALELAGVEVRPDVLHAPPGERVLLESAAGGGRRATGSRALLGLLALAAVVAVAAVAATVAGDGGNSADEDLPPGQAPTSTTTSAAPAPTTTPTATQTTPSETTPATTATTPTTTSRTPTTTPRRPAAPRVVTVRVNPLDRPTYLCVEDGSGRQLFSGTLSAGRVFRGSHLRLNIGLGSTRVRVNGRVVTLDGSPAGLDVTPGRVRPLPLGQRPCG